MKLVVRTKSNNLYRGEVIDFDDPRVPEALQDEDGGVMHLIEDMTNNVVVIIGETIEAIWAHQVPLMQKGSD